MLDLIGNTPLKKVEDIWIKCEFLNPTGSSKDRIAKKMVLQERRNTIVEATSGNTGISLAFVCSILHKPCIIFCPKSTSNIKIKLIDSYGAIVYNNYYSIKEAKDAARNHVKNHSYQKAYIDQFNNRANIDAQYEMALEIKQWFIPDAIVCGIGTSGTLAGLYRAFPNATFFTPKPQNFEIEGICDGVTLFLKPKKCNLVEVPVKANKVHLTQRFLSYNYGMNCGFSTAANYLIANDIKINYKKVLIIAHDAGWRYL